jgi:tetratricopeptide (TPR) repeat protein
MSLFSFRNKSRLKKLDKSSTSAEVLAIKGAYDRGQYTEFEQLLNDASTIDMIELATKFPENSFSQKYVGQNPDNAGAHFLYGSHLIAKAWQARGKGVASTVSEDKVSAFYSFLNAAQAEFHTIAQLDPKFKAIYAPLITIQMGKGDHAMANNIYDQAVKMAPNLLDYHIVRLTMLAPKWGGSEEEMFSFARDNAQRDETGLLHGLIVAAHFEKWHMLEGKQAKRYFKDKKVVREIEQAYLEIEHAELSDNFYDQFQYFLALNYSALIMLLMNKGKKARKIFKAIGSNYTKRPWVNMGKEPGLAFLKFKKLA